MTSKFDLQPKTGEGDVGPPKNDPQSGGPYQDNQYHQPPCYDESWILDMETGDPDDVVMLLLCGAHPAIGSKLRAVTLTPGSKEQVGLVRWILQELKLTSVRVGAQEWPTHADKKGCMTGRFYDCFGSIPPTKDGDCEPAAQLIHKLATPQTTMVTGGFLCNLAAALEIPGFCLGRWVGQGGFAGDGVVPPELQMLKFKGKKYCETWNFNGNIPAATAVLAAGQDKILRKVLVSKNVAHKVVYDDVMHKAVGMAIKEEKIAPKQSRKTRGGPKERREILASRLPSLQLLHDSMGAYLRGKVGKKLHDPFCLMVAVNENISTLVEVMVHRCKCHRYKYSADGGSHGWGSVLCPGSGIWITIDYDSEAFLDTMLQS